MASVMRERGVALRPHAKTHKSLEFGRRQLRAGAVGLTVATIGEAEVFAAGGVDDLFIAFPLVAHRAEGGTVRRLAERCTLSVGADSTAGLESLADAFRERPARRASSSRSIAAVAGSAWFPSAPARSRVGDQNWG